MFALSIPDFDTGVITTTGVAKIFLPRAGVLLIDVGRNVFTSDDTVLAQSGKHPLDQYYLYGDKSIMLRVCAALGSPGTP